ncbi:LysR family transcriptional regulator [Saccharobesus litoralis]|uniref:LysR family transcriptional regulator n=1 Tax=Saccharobesus litoralis TaxID=2172099 RepID=A0A2S0VXI1_9ALTE|nr:LysR family transcriptional regulator [Saccharobesus litoralis]
MNNALFDGFVIFRQVIESGGFSAAADTLGHSTSYISKEINKLEERLGVRLLNRTTRSVGLTPEGKDFYQQCVQIVQDAEHAVARLNSHNVKPKGNLKISCPTSLGINVLQPILSEYRQQYPDVTLELDVNDRKVDVVQDGYDLAIRATNQLDESSLICRKIMSSQALTVTSQAYIDKFGKPQSPQELADHQTICYSNLKNTTRWFYYDTNGDKISVDVKPAMLSNSAAMELAMVIDGHGICRMPAFNMQEELNSGLLVTLFDELPKPNIDVYVVYPSRKHLSPKIRCFIDLLVARIAN